MIRTLAALLIALPLAAQSNPRAFANGPAKWLMTADEQQAWRKVKTDDEARDLMDLFFARRDPTPGTPRNEFRTEFESRVAFADRQFKEGDVRGSLTERGRTLIVLGFPRNLDVQASHQSSQSGNVQGFDPNDPTGGRQMAAKDVWTYTHEAAAKFGVPKIEVVFIHDFTGDRVHRDPQRTDFTMALPGAIRSYIVSPDLTTVPEWAASRLTDDRTIVPAQESAQTSTTETVKKTQTIIDAPRPIARPAGAGKLTLLADTNSLKPQSGADPFVIASLDHFKKDQDLGWAAEYCSGVISENALPVKVQLKLAGKDGTISSDPEEYVPDSIKASPGCYLLRGSVPLSDVDPGSYTLTVAITGTGGQQSYNLTRELRVE